MEALFYQVDDQGMVQCLLCPHFCRIPAGHVGRCHSRKNTNGKLYAINIGQVCAFHNDPIEKKPLYHFLPGSHALSLGNNGCNLRCTFCQNWEISQQTVPTQTMSPPEIVRLANQHRSQSIAFTYSEPIVWYEFVKDASICIHDSGLKSIMVTNGMINPEPLQELLPHIDAMNIDIKSMNPDFYRRLCGGYLEPVLEAAELASRSSHVEITYLIIPGENDSEQEFHQLGQFIRDHLGIQTPLHLSRYHPAYHLTNPATPVETLLSARKIAQEYLHFVYLGNVVSQDGSSTRCPKCRQLLIRRDGYRILERNISDDAACLNCGTTISLILQ